MTGYRRTWPRGRSWSAPLLGLLVAGTVGCGSLLDVQNPNNVNATDTEKPVAAGPLANGAQRQVAFGIDYSMLVYATASDELDWVGSRDAWKELDQGKLSNGYNEFSDQAFPPMAEGRWLADYAIKTLEALQTDGTLPNALDLAKAYLWGAIAYTTIADMYDDWALSDRDSSAAPVGQANMGSFYDTAIDYLNKGYAIANGKDAALALAIRAMRARSSFSRAIWDLVGQRPIAASRIVSGGSAYVTNAVGDANGVLGAVPSSTWNYRFTFSSATTTPNTGAWVNERQEMRIGATFAVPSATAPTWTASFIKDPIDVGTLAKVPNDVQLEWKQRYIPYTIVSAREMHLILAEAALAGATTGKTFTQHINDLRALDALTPYAAQISNEDMLHYSRKVNLFMQGRSLSDLYRFRKNSPDWLTGSQGTQGGWFIPITAIECLSNKNIGAAGCST